MAQQYKELTFKEKWNICFAIMLWHQRCLVLGERRFWGSEALGKPCAFAIGLMLIWHFFSQDSGMLLWLAGWLVMLIVRRIEAIKVTRSGQVTSQYDGWPKTTMIFTKSERLAKLVVEPAMIGLLGVAVFQFYQAMGWRPTGAVIGNLGSSEPESNALTGANLSKISRYGVRSRPSVVRIA